MNKIENNTMYDNGVNGFIRNNTKLFINDEIKSKIKFRFHFKIENNVITMTSIFKKSKCGKKYCVVKSSIYPVDSNGTFVNTYPVVNFELLSKIQSEVNILKEWYINRYL